ncbi:MAG: hypothetical protein ACTSO7_03455 [Candidatus Heimdallarchaeota archaeon]
MKRVKHIRQGIFYVMVILFVVLLPITSVNGEFTREDFSLDNETRVFLNVSDAGINYTGSIVITLTSGANLTATFNGNTKIVTLTQTRTFTIFNTSSLHFQISTEGASVGYFDLDLSEVRSSGNDNPIITILVVLGATLFAISVIAYYLRLRSFKRDPDEEDEELIDPYVAKKRKEAAGAQKQFWSLDKEE